MCFPFPLLANKLSPQAKPMKTLHEESTALISKLPQLDKLVHADLIAKFLQHGIGELDRREIGLRVPELGGLN